MSSDILRNQIARLEARIQSLEAANRATLDSLELALTLGDFQASVNSFEEPDAIVAEAASRAGRLIPFKALCVLLVDETTAEFVPALVEPPDALPLLRAELDVLIENRHFAFAVKRRRPTITLTRDNADKLLLHALSTSSRTRGMFVGVLEPGFEEAPDIHLAVFSLILQNCANAIESFELYRLVRRINNDLNSQVEALTASRGEIDRQRERLERRADRFESQLGQAETLLDAERRRSRDAEAKAAEAEERLRGMRATPSDSAGDAKGFFQSTPGGVFLSAGPVLARMLGYESAEAAAVALKDLRQALYVDPFERDRLLRELDEKGVAENFRTRFKRKCGAVLPVAISCRAVRDVDGRLLYIEGRVAEA